MLKQMKTAAAALALSLLAATPLMAQQGRKVQCLLVVNGFEAIRGPCLFSPSDKSGSFQISSLNGKFFALVLIDRPGIGTGYWNEEPYAGHAHSDLGTLTREDACWVNQFASVCAW